ncbi:MAG: FHA domain-containing protein [Firmicutes bacterium]|nr:FHA domain-containing protein [Bacillota bacterium]
MENIEFKFDKNYLVAELHDVQLINYSMEMLLHAHINYLCSVNRQSINNKLYLYYDVSNRTSLDKMTAYRKMSQQDFTMFVTDCLNAIKEVEAYQLEPASIVVDSKYIFVHPSDYKPNFIYLPIARENDGVKDMVNFLKNMLVSNMVEISDANAMQIIIGALNLDKSIDEMLKEVKNINDPGQNVVRQQSPTPSIPQPKKEQFAGQPDPVVQPHAETPRSAAPKAPPVQPVNTPVQPVSSPIQPQPYVATTQQNTTSTPKVPGNAKVYGIMAAVAVVIAGVFGAMYFGGTFKDDKGNNDPAVLVAVPVMILAADYFIYKKFKNTPSNVPVAQVKTNTTNNNINNNFKSNNNNAVPTPKIPQSAPRSEITPQKVPVVQTPPPILTPNKVQINEGSEKTEIFEDAAPSPILVDSRGNRIELKSQITRIGRLQAQVDIYLSNPKVSRIHADIILRDGKVFVMDLGSSRGTYINGSPERISNNTEVELQNNDTVAFANEVYRVYC